MNEKTVKRLFDMEFDEVSMVDRPANQHGVIAISKAFEEDDNVSIFDESGAEVDIDDLEHGDVVYNDAGEELVVVDEDDTEVGKAFAVNAAGSATKLGTDLVRSGEKAKKTGRFRQFRQGWNNDGRYGEGASRAYRAGGFASRNRNTLAAAGTGVAGVTAGAGGGYLAGKSKDDIGKSLGDALMEELSKAASEDQRNEIVAKALDEVEIAKAAAAEAWQMAEAERDLRVTEAYIAKAAEYNLPVSPDVLGPILKAASSVLTEEQVDVLDQLFTAIGEDIYDEIGYAGQNDNDDVLGLVEAHAAEYIGKADVSGAQAISDIFDANPDLYDAYLSEKGL